MLKSKFIKRSLLISQTIVLLVIAAIDSAIAQSFNFVDLNQSRQFFNQGNSNIEHEIEALEENERLPKIKLPQNYQKPQDINKPDSLDMQHKLQSMSYSASDNWDSVILK